MSQIEEGLNTSKYNDLRIIISQNSVKWMQNLSSEFQQCKTAEDPSEAPKQKKMGA